MSQSKITLQCVKEKSRLRIKFHSFTNDEGKVYTNVYDNSLNCQFPKSIREEGAFYEIGPHDLILVDSGGARAAFYNVNKNKITRIGGPPSSTASDASADPVVVYEILDCVICMSEASVTVFVPCGHKCTCKDCYDTICKHARNGRQPPSCPLCRRSIDKIMA